MLIGDGGECVERGGSSLLNLGYDAVGTSCSGHDVGESADGTVAFGVWWGRLSVIEILVLGG